jgi:hypothetical protein
MAVSTTLLIRKINHLLQATTLCTTAFNSCLSSSKTLPTIIAIITSIIIIRKRIICPLVFSKLLQSK